MAHLNRALRRRLERQKRRVKVEEQKSEKRTIEQIQQEYNQTAARLGGLTYQARLLNAELEQLMQRMSELNREANEANKGAEDGKAS